MKAVKEKRKELEQEMRLLAEGTAPEPRGQVMLALDRLDKAIAENAAMMGVLVDRLALVLAPVDGEENGGWQTVEMESSMSPLAERLTDYAVALEEQGDRLQAVVERVEL